MIELPPGRVHLWYVPFDAIDPAALLTACRGLMAPEEVVQYDRFRFAPDRHRYLVKRALARSSLSRYLPVPPPAWRFTRNSHGRPEVAEPRAGRDLRFNLSSTPGLAVCLLARGVDLGVDVEDTQRAGATVEIAERYFAPSEARALAAQPPGQRRARFFDYWTLKEAYVKARGMGLAIPLDSFAFELEDPSQVRVRFGGDCPDDAGQWQFRLHRPSQRHVVAVAVRGADRPLSIEVRRASLLGA